MTDIGLIGVGYIGKLFLDTLLEAGHSVTVFDVDDSQVAYATDRGATSAASPAEVAASSDVVVTALPGSPEVEATMDGEDGLLEGLSEGDLVIDASTTRPETSVVCDELCQERGAAFVEAPITGGAPREGYHMMVGGSEANYEAASDVLDVLCADHARVGDAGDATIFKLGLQLRYAGHDAVDAEVVSFLEDNGVDAEPLADFLGMDVSEPFFTGDFTQEIEGMGGLAIWHKDVGYAREFAREHETALPLAAVVHEAYKATVRRTDDSEGHAAALIRYWRLLNDAENRGG